MGSTHSAEGQVNAASPVSKELKKKKTCVTDRLQDLFAKYPSPGFGNQSTSYAVKTSEDQTTTDNSSGDEAEAAKAAVLISRERQKQFNKHHQHARPPQYAKGRYFTQNGIANTTPKTGIEQVVERTHLRPSTEDNKAATLGGFAPKKYGGDDMMDGATMDGATVKPADEALWTDFCVTPKIAQALIEDGQPTPLPVQKAVFEEVLRQQMQVVLNAPHAVGKTEALTIAALQVAYTAHRNKEMIMQHYNNAPDGPGSTSPQREFIEPRVIIILTTHDPATKYMRRLHALNSKAELGLDCQLMWDGQPGLCFDADGSYPDIDIAVCCVGRLWDMLQRDILRLSSLKLLIIDEIGADPPEEIDITKEGQQLIDVIQQINEKASSTCGLRIVLAGPKLSQELGDGLMEKIFSKNDATVVHIDCIPGPSIGVRL